MTATENPIQVEHAAAAVMREAPSTRADVAALQAIRAAKGSKSLFEREAVPSDTEKKPNFPEVHATLARFNPPRPDLVATATRVQEIVEGRAPAAGGPDAHIQLIGAVAANMPGMVAAISKETGLTPAVVKARLRTNLTGMKPILRRLQADNEFISNLGRNVANLEYTEDMQDMDSKLTALDNKIVTSETDINNRKWVYTNVGAPVGTPPGVVEWHNNPATLPPGQEAVIRANMARYDAAQSMLNDSGLGSFRRAGLSNVEVPNYKTALDAQLTMIAGGNDYAHLIALPVGTTIDSIVDAAIPIPVGANAATINAITARQNARIQEIHKLMVAYRAANDIGAMYGGYTVGRNLDGDIDKLKKYDESRQKLKEIQTEQDTLDQDKAQRDKLKIQRDKKLNEYGNKVGSLVDRSFKEYYNEVLLKEAEQIAELDANKKVEDKKKAEDLKQKREQDARELLSKYLRLSYLRYRGGRVVGWDDATIKRFVKQDMLSSSPAMMGRKLLERVHAYRATLPPTYQTEINKLLTDMGVGAGPPPVTFTNVLDSMDTSFMTNLAGEEMPKVLGYAYARGYYFDKLKMTKDQAEFLRTAYSADFFTQALGSKEEFRKQMEAEFGKGVMTGEMREKIKQILVGKDWEQGMKKLLRVAAIGGLTVAGLNFLGGTAGVAGGINTLAAVGKAGADVVRAASQATAYGLRTGSGFVSDKMAEAAGLVNPLPGAPQLVPEPPPIAPTVGGSA